MKIKIKVTAACLVTNVDGSVLIDVSHSAIEKGKGSVNVEAQESAYLINVIQQRPELTLIGQVEEKEINPETGKPYTKKELDKLAASAAGGPHEDV